jgi:hypothetical protein
MAGCAVACEQFGRAFALVDVGLGARHRRDQDHEKPDHRHKAPEHPNPT